MIQHFLFFSAYHAFVETTNDPVPNRESSGVQTLPGLLSKIRDLLILYLTVTLMDQNIIGHRIYL